MEAAVFVKGGVRRPWDVGMPPGNTLNNAFWRHIYTELRNQVHINPQVIIGRPIEIKFTKLNQECGGGRFCKGVMGVCPPENSISIRKKSATV